MKIELKPYCLVDGVATMRTSDLVRLYERMQIDDTARLMNYEGQVPNAFAFVQIARSAAFFARVMADGVPVAVVWLNRWEHRRAHLHFCVFKTAWGDPAVEIGKYVVNELIHMKGSEGQYLFDVLWGAIPSTNRMAAAFLKRCGAREGGLLPNYIYNAVTGQSEDANIFYYIRGK